jgi:uncharacterized protein (DUF58 family)
MALSALLQRLAHWLRHWQQQFAASAIPLLSPQELAQLHQAANTAVALSAQREVHHPLLGERSSVFAGSGYEFADNRLYSAGDDMRFINWRLYARSGQLYRKMFLEERRPPVWLVVDRRNPMRFGTQQRLKITQAARLAMFTVYRALRQQLPCAAVLLEHQAHWLPMVRQQQTLQALQTALLAPAAVTHDTTEIALPQVLRQLHSQLQPGCLVFMISDFHDLAATTLPLLAGLSQRHRLLAYHVIDPIELTLPSQGDFAIFDDATQTSVRLNCDDAVSRRQLTQSLQHYQAGIEALLRQAGVEYQRCLTTTDSLPSTTTMHHVNATQ